MEEQIASAHSYEGATLAEVYAWALDIRGTREQQATPLIDRVPGLVAIAVRQVLEAARVVLGKPPPSDATTTDSDLAALGKHKASEALTRGLFTLLVVHRARAAAAVQQDVSRAFAGRK